MARRWAIRGVLVALVVFAFGCVVKVTPAAPGGWFFANEGANGTGYFTNGPGTPPAGRGSALLTIDGTGRESIATLNFKGKTLASLTSLRYSTFVAASTSPNESLTLQFDADYDATDGNDSYQSRLVYVPGVSAAVAPGTWQDWDTLAGPAGGTWYSAGSGASAYRPIVGGVAQASPPCNQADYCTWSEVLADYPHARIRPTTGALLVRAGGPVAGGFSGATDKVIVGVSGSDTTYDFEPGDGLITVNPTTAPKLSFGFSQETAAGTGAFVTGPTGADGVGSAQLTVNASGGEALSSAVFAGTRIDRFTALTYKTYLQPTYPANAPTVQFDADYDDSDTSTAFQGRFLFEPSVAGAGAVTASSWQTWSPLTAPSGWWQTGNATVSDADVGMACTQALPCSWTAFKAAYPNARVRPVVGQVIGIANAGRVWLKAGSNWGGFAGNVDSLTVGIDGVGATYNLEP